MHLPMKRGSFHARSVFLAARGSGVPAVAVGLVGLAGGCAVDSTGTTSESRTGTTASAYYAAPPDATGFGPYGLAIGDYKLPAALYPDVHSAVTELWARLYRPKTLTPGDQYPLVVFLHGNHATCGDLAFPRKDGSCQYTTTGTCGGAYPVVTPNHLGYRYVAEQLASWGYFVVSINANRGITCGAGVPGDWGLNLARGRLVLKHLEMLSKWNNGILPTPASLGVDLSNNWLDFSNVGLMGHSRGGEGMRAAYKQYPGWAAKIPDPVTFTGIFEIGPVDGQTSLTLNPDETNWAVLLPSCDGDVSNLQGMRPFDRVLKINEANATPKATFTVFGTNHNFYNTEWQYSDSSGCSGTYPKKFPPSGGSPLQQTVGRAAMMGFFRGITEDPTYARVLDPAFVLPPTISGVTRIDRGYTDSPSTSVSQVLDDIPGGGPPKSTDGLLYDYSPGVGFAVVNGGVGGEFGEHDPTQTAASIRWDVSPTAGAFWQSNWNPRILGTYGMLDIRLERQRTALPPAPTKFSIVLVKGGGGFSAPVKSKDYVDLTGPFAGPYNNYHVVMQTARIPLSDFGGINLTTETVRGVRFIFDDSSGGAIYAANIRADSGPDLTLSGTLNASMEPETPSATTMMTPVDNGDTVYRDGNTIVGSTVVPAANGQDEAVEVTLASPNVFMPRDELLVAEIGGRELVLSRYPTDGDLGRVTFTLPRKEIAQIPAGTPVTVKYGRGVSRTRWELGALDVGAARGSGR